MFQLAQNDTGAAGWTSSGRTNEIDASAGTDEDLVISALFCCACRCDVVVRRRDACDRAHTFQIQFVCSEKHN